MRCAIGGSVFFDGIANALCNQRPLFPNVCVKSGVPFLFFAIEYARPMHVHLSEWSILRVSVSTGAHYDRRRCILH